MKKEMYVTDIQLISFVKTPRINSTSKVTVLSVEEVPSKSQCMEVMGGYGGGYSGYSPPTGLPSPPVSVSSPPQQHMKTPSHLIDSRPPMQQSKWKYCDRPKIENRNGASEKNFFLYTFTQNHFPNKCLSWSVLSPCNALWTKSGLILQKNASETAVPLQ
ncbi:unnamed protein product [Nesidiocoris tenuis]|uniref:Uncharacterized protein n=1 Tax=Nesidiocoris tenuis TaxID=355587 RepID=A0A6H5FTM1_9HEMI|nr:unnamed protein product [Nesidiocoris tenuis]